MLGRRSILGVLRYCAGVSYISIACTRPVVAALWPLLAFDLLPLLLLLLQVLRLRSW
jgi:hypothetical protein